MSYQQTKAAVKSNMLGVETLRALQNNIEIYENYKLVEAQGKIAEQRSIESKSASEITQKQLDEAVKTGTPIEEVGQAHVDSDGNVFGTLVDRLNTKEREALEKIALAATKEELQEKEKFSRETWGNLDKAAVRSAIANSDDPNRAAQVMGFRDTQHASEYPDRDTVADYRENSSRKPLLTVTDGVITYDSSTVKITMATIANFEKIRVGSIIDTLHTPNRFVGIVSKVDKDTQTVYTKEGWYEVKSGGSPSPSVPTAGVGFRVDMLTKVWTANDNLFIREGDNVKHGVINESGIFRYASDLTGSVGGYDVVNFANKATFAYLARKATNAIAGFMAAFLARDADFAFRHETNDRSLYTLASFINGDPDDGFQITASGLQSKLKLRNDVVTDADKQYKDKNQSTFIFNRTSLADFVLKSPVGREGEVLVLVNFGSADVVLKNENGAGGFVFNGSAKTSAVMLSQTELVMISDNTHWFLINPSVKDGTAKFNSMNLSGSLTIADTGASSFIEIGNKYVKQDVFVDFNSSGFNNDFSSRIIATGGTSTNGQGILNIIAKDILLNNYSVPNTIIENGRPTIAPKRVNQEWLDQGNKKLYRAFGTSSIDDWVLMN